MMPLTWVLDVEICWNTSTVFEMARTRLGVILPWTFEPAQRRFFVNRSLDSFMTILSDLNISTLCRKVKIQEFKVRFLIGKTREICAKSVRNLCLKAHGRVWLGPFQPAVQCSWSPASLLYTPCYSWEMSVAVRFILSIHLPMVCFSESNISNYISIMRVLPVVNHLLRISFCQMMSLLRT